MSVKFKGKNITGVYIKNHEIVKAVFRNKVVYEKESPEPPTPTGDEFVLSFSGASYDSNSKQVAFGTQDSYNLSLGGTKGSVLTLKEYYLKVELEAGKDIAILNCHIPRLFNGAWWKYRTMEGTLPNTSDTTLFDGAYHKVEPNQMQIATVLSATDQEIVNGYMGTNIEASGSYPDLYVSNVVFGTNEISYEMLDTSDDSLYCKIYVKDIKYGVVYDVAGTTYDIANDILTFGGSKRVNGSTYYGIGGISPSLVGVSGNRTAICGYNVSAESGYTAPSNVFGLSYVREDNGNLIIHTDLKKNDVSNPIQIPPAEIGTNKSAFALSVRRTWKAGRTTLTIAQQDIEWDSTNKQLKLYDIRSGRVLMGTITITSLKVFVW